MPNQKIADLAGLTAARGDLIPVDRSGTDGHVSAAGIFAASADYIDIRDYGTVVDGGDITAAWIAALTAYGVSHTNRRIRIPMVGSGTYTLDGAALTAMYRFPGGSKQGAWIFELDCMTINLTSPLALSSNHTWRGMRTYPLNLFITGTMPAPGFVLANGIDAPTFSTYDGTAPSACTNWRIENLHFVGNNTNGIALHVIGGSLGHVTDCWCDTEGPDAPLVVDTIFWVDFERLYCQPRAAADLPAIRFTTETAPTGLAVGLIRVKDLKTTRNGILFENVSAAAGPCSNIEIYDLVSEGQLDGTSLLYFDSTSGTGIAQIKIIRPEIADPVSGTCYLIKNTAATPVSTSNVYIEGSTFAGAVYDPASNYPIRNLTIDSTYASRDQQGQPTQLALYNAGTPNYAAWRRDWQNSIDAKLLCAPIPGAQWNYGTPVAIVQDPANWVPETPGTITTGKRGPDGSTMAAECTGRFNCGAGISMNLNVGDYLIGGIWVRGTGGSGIECGISAGPDPNNGWETNGENNPAQYYSWDYRSPETIAADGWHWVCGAAKFTTAGTNPVNIVFAANIGNASNRYFFGPSLVYIPASEAEDDAWMIKMARMLRGGWSSKCPAGSVSILDHQQFWSGKGMAMVDGVTAPSTVAGFAQIYIDSAGAAPKAKYGDGTVKTLGVATSSAIPTTGTAVRGDVAFNVLAAQGQPMGWICVASGSPGQWVQLPNVEHKSQGAFTGSGAATFGGTTATGLGQGALSATGTGTAALVGVNASSLLLGETEGFSIKATSAGGAVRVIDIGTPGNNLNEVALDSSNLVQSSASTKVVNWSDGTLHTIAAGDIPQQYDSVLSQFGILIEPAATNLALRSQEFNDAVWPISSGVVSVTSNAAVAPDGTTTAEKVIEKVAVVSDKGQAQGPLTVVSGSVYTFSIYAKAAERSQVGPGFINNDFGGGVFAGFFDMSTGTFLSAGGTFGTGATYISQSAENIGNGWYRISITGSLTTTAARVNYAMGSGGDANYVGDGVSGLYVWGAQLELGSVPTSYIATTTAAVARAADVISVDTSTFPWSDSFGTLYLDYKPLNVSSGTRYAWAAYVDANNHISLFGSAANPTMGNRTAGSTDVATDLGTLVAGSRTQITVAYGANDFDGSQDGTTASSDATAATAATYPSLYLGTTGVTGSELHGYIYRLVYVPRHVETDANNIESWRYNF